MESRRLTPLWAVLAVVSASCGPSVGVPSGSGDGTSSGGELSETTAGEGISESSMVDESSTGSTVDPSGDCPAEVAGLTWLWCGDVSVDAPLAADDGFVYFATVDDGIWRVPLGGGDAEGLVGGTGDIFSLEVIDNTVYWANFQAGVVGYKPLPSGPSTVLADDLFKPSSVAAGGGYVFVTQYGDGLPLVRYHLDSGEVTDLYPGLDHAGLAHVEGDELLFAESINNGNIATPLLRGDFEGGELVTLMTGPYGLEDFEREGDIVWWLLYDPTGSSLMRSIVSPELSVSVLFEVVDHPFSMALTPQRVYWSEWTNPPGPSLYSVRSITREGTDPIVHEQASKLSSVVATNAGVVFAREGAIARID